MNASDVRKLYAYTDWADDRILAAIAGLSEEQFARQIVSSLARNARRSAAVPCN